MIMKAKDNISIKINTEIGCVQRHVRVIFRIHNAMLRGVSSEYLTNQKGDNS